MEKNKKWYILNVVSGQENKILNNINLMIANNNFKGKVEEAIIPTKQIVKIKKGNKVNEVQKIFPGYVFIKGEIDSDVYNILKSIPKVSGFLGRKNMPEEVSQSKMDSIFQMIKDSGEDKKDASFEIGEQLNVIDGPFEAFTGIVEEVDSDKKRVKISISIFGRSTSVELDYSQVEKI